MLWRENKMAKEIKENKKEIKAKTNKISKNKNFVDEQTLQDLNLINISKQKKPFEIKDEGIAIKVLDNATLKKYRLANDKPRKKTSMLNCKILTITLLKLIILKNIFIRQCSNWSFKRNNFFN